MAPLLAGEAVPMMQSDTTTPNNTGQDWRSIVHGALISPSSAGALGVAQPGVLAHTYNPAGGTVMRDGHTVQRVSAGQGVLVRGGHFVINRATFGSYIAYVPGVQTDVPIIAADATNPVVTSIVVRLWDKSLAPDAAGAEHGVYFDSLNGAPGAINLTGTRGSAGAPPVLPDGCVELAQISRLANQNTITDAMITLVRKSSSLFGTTRDLLEGDRLSDPGLYPGENRRRRGVHVAGLPVVEMVDKWDPASATWRGTTPFRLPRPNALVGWTSTHTGSASTRYTVAQVSIPDPGWPYYIDAVAQLTPVDITVDGGSSHYMELYVDSTNPPTTPQANRIDSVFAGGRTQGFHMAKMAAQSRTVFTGAHTLYFLYFNGVTGIASWTRLDQNPKWQFDVTIVPQP